MLKNILPNQRKILVLRKKDRLAKWLQRTNSTMPVNRCSTEPVEHPPQRVLFKIYCWGCFPSLLQFCCTLPVPSCMPPWLSQPFRSIFVYLVHSIPTTSFTNKPKFVSPTRRICHSYFKFQSMSHTFHFTEMRVLTVELLIPGLSSIKFFLVSLLYQQNHIAPEICNQIWFA